MPRQQTWHPVPVQRMRLRLLQQVFYTWSLSILADNEDSNDDRNVHKDNYAVVQAELSAFRARSLGRWDLIRCWFVRSTGHHIPK